MVFGFIDSSGPGTAPSAGFSQWRDKAVQQALHCMSHTGASVPSAAAWKHYCLQCCTEIFIYLFGGLWPCALVLLSDLLLGIRFSTHWIPSWTWTPSNLWQVRGHTKFHSTHEHHSLNGNLSNISCIRYVLPFFPWSVVNLCSIDVEIWLQADNRGVLDIFTPDSFLFFFGGGCQAKGPHYMLKLMNALLLWSFGHCMFEQNSVVLRSQEPDSFLSEDKSNMKWQ